MMMMMPTYTAGANFPSGDDAGSAEDELKIKGAAGWAQEVMTHLIIVVVHFSFTLFPVAVLVGMYYYCWPSCTVCPQLLAFNC